MGRKKLFVFGLFVLLSFQASIAQEDAKPELLSVASVKNLVKAAQSDHELSEDVKSSILEYLQEAIDRIDISFTQLEKCRKFERQLKTAAEALKRVQNRLANLPDVVNADAANGKSIVELEELVENLEKHLDDPVTGLRKEVQNFESEAALHRTRPGEIISEIAEVEDRLREISDELESFTGADESREVVQSHQLFLQARRQRAECELRALQAEQDWYQSPLSSNLLDIQREFAAKSLAHKVAELTLLQNALGVRRENEADRRVHEAENAVKQVEIELKTIAEENLALTKEQREVGGKLSEVEEFSLASTTLLDDLRKDFERTQEMVNTVGLTDSIGLLLRQKRAKLPDARSIQADLRRRNEAVREVRMRQFQLELDRSSLIDLDHLSAKRAAELGVTKGRKNVLEKIRTLLGEQRQLNKGLEADFLRYFEQLVHLDNVERQLLSLTKKYADYVDERVLWIRTGQTFDSDHLAKVTPSLLWISDQKQWMSVIEAVKQDALRHSMSWIIAVVFVSVLICIGPFFAGMIRRQGLMAAEDGCHDLWPTIKTLAATLALASGWPCFIWFVAWRLDHSAVQSPFVLSVAAGLIQAALFFFPLELLRVACAHGGLAERHFDWPSQSIQNWRRNLTWFLPAGAVLIGVIGLLEGTADEHRLDSFGRLTFMLLTVISAIFCQFAIRRANIDTTDNPGKSSNDSDIWADRFWRFAPRLAVATCLGLFVLGWMGYFYTALQLTWRLQQTAWLAIGLVMVRASVRRWIALERRRMAILQDIELQTIAESSREPANSGHNPFLFPLWSWPDFRLNLTQIVSQMRSLLDTCLVTMAIVGLWFVWADVTPALNILDRVTLWETTVEQAVTSTDAKVDSIDAKVGSTVQMIKRSKRVTAADLGLAVLIIAVSTVAGRNIPGLVEVILLEHMGVDAGIRFASTSLIRYAIFVAGVCGAFTQVGIGWNNVQWLVAAASVGLGFGLQEIFCNFVSGIILLFERPMRVGDVITIGDTTGTVSRIRFRATTIVDGDRKELVVPNKEFITGKLLNWTLSDRVNRVAVKVVVSAENDPQKVRRMLLDIAAENPLLLKDPAPTATLEELNGGLNFMLRGFLPTLDGRQGAVHDLYAVIHDRFRREGIEMPCPSQEVFVRMDRHDAQASTPPAPHQSPVGVPIKTISSDFGNTFRRA